MLGRICVCTHVSGPYRVPKLTLVPGTNFSWTLTFLMRVRRRLAASRTASFLWRVLLAVLPAGPNFYKLLVTVVTCTNVFVFGEIVWLESTYST